MTHIEVYKLFEDILQLVQFAKYGSSVMSLQVTRNVVTHCNADTTHHLMSY